MTSAELAKQIAAAMKRGDRATAKKLTDELNAKTTKKHMQFKAGTWRI